MSGFGGSLFGVCTGCEVVFETIFEKLQKVVVCDIIKSSLADIQRGKERERDDAASGCGTQP